MVWRMRIKMAVYNNYRDVNSIEPLLSEIEKALELRMYYAALHMALSIPDILSKVAYNLNKTSKQFYIKWFNENVKDGVFGYLYSENPLHNKEDDTPRINGKMCYALRCALLHEGGNNIEDGTKIKEFVLSFTNEDFVRGNYAGVEPEFDKNGNYVGNNHYLYISCKGLCKDLVSAAKAFIKNNPNLNYQKVRINSYGGKFNEYFIIDKK